MKKYSFRIENGIGILVLEEDTNSKEASKEVYNNVPEDVLVKEIEELGLKIREHEASISFLKNEQAFRWSKLERTTHV